MISSELIFKKKVTVLSQFLNILNTFFIRGGKNKSNFFILTNFLLYLKNSEKSGNGNSAFLKFYDFVSKLTPRINVVSVENKKAGKVFKIPMPPLKSSMLQHNFVVSYARSIKNSNTDFKKFVNQLVQVYSDTIMNEKGEFFKQRQLTYDILKEHKFRAKKRHDKQVKIKKISIKNAIKKSKQFYI